MLREKIVAAASRRLVIVVDQEKLVERLAEHTPVPVEVTQFGWQATAVALAKLGCVPERRYTVGEQPYVTDGGNYILDCRFRPAHRSGQGRKKHRDDSRRGRKRAFCGAQLYGRRCVPDWGRRADTARFETSIGVQEATRRAASCCSSKGSAAGIGARLPTRCG